MSQNKTLFRIFAVLAGMFFVFNVYLLIKGLGSVYNIHLGELAPFENDNVDPRYQKLIKEFNEKIVGYKQEVRTLQNYNIVINLVVTGLSAASALVTSLKAISEEAIGKSFLRAVALLTFFGTIASWANGQVTDFKGQADQSLQKCRESKTQFMTLYDAESNSGNKAKIIGQYEDKITDL
jgi:hypothetical protein